MQIQSLYLIPKVLKSISLNQQYSVCSATDNPRPILLLVYRDLTRAVCWRACIDILDIVVSMSPSPDNDVGQVSESFWGRAL